MLNLAHEENNIKLVAIYGKNCEEWLMTDLAANCFGVTTVAIYDTLGADSMNFILN
jgi:long-subunit acyl-CoA synthetase (AMP-forming)